MSEVKQNEQYDQLFSLAMRLALKAGDIIIDTFLKEKTIGTKSGDIDLVTESDKLCEKVIIEGIKAVYPHHKFIAEESFSGNRFEFVDDPTWLIDPIDGTTNFVHAFPFICVSIALTINKGVVLGIIHNPIMKETFHAIKGKGSFLNNMRLSVSKVNSISKAIVCTEFGYDRTPEGVEQMLGRYRRMLLANVQAIRALGSCALNMCAIAAGRAELYYEGKNSMQGPKPWDMAAGQLIVMEAGGVCLDPATGGPLDWTSGRVMAGNSEALSRYLIDLIKY